MHAFKVFLSFLALAVMVAAGITEFGPDHWQVAGWLPELFSAAGIALAWVGYQPIQLPAPAARGAAVLGMMFAAFVTSHVAAWGDGHKHQAIVVVSFVAALLTALGRGPLVAKAAAPPEPPAQPPPVPKP